MSQLPRRDFLRNTTAAGLGLGLTVPAWAIAKDHPPTPPATPGPFYPVPGIQNQTHHDTDMTRKLGNSEVAKRQISVVNGTIRDLDGRPLKSAIVEIWQACTSGKYNHSRDDNKAPLDEKFQFWGYMRTKEDGQYEFKTIKPGRYPGRTPHIHFQIMAHQHRKLVTQLYFSDESKANAKDFIYNRLKPKQRNLVTSEFEKCKEQAGVMKGKFDVFLKRA